jgi:predicted nuclease of predicted toxin-antitoxin system
MKLLLDESLPRRLRDHLPGHDVATVQECGWAGTTNGKLLSLAESDYEAFLTADQNL